MSQWTNNDGLTIMFEGEQEKPVIPSPATVVSFGPMSYMVVDLNFDNLPNENRDLDNDGTNDGWSNADPYIPAGSAITRAFVVVETAFTTGSSAALNIGLSQQNGTVIDVDGIDAAIAVSALAANDMVDCDGALVNSAATIGANNAYVTASPSTGSFTAGKAKLVIEYITVTV